MAVLVNDTFTRTVADDLGTSDSAHTYSVYGGASSLDVDGAKLVVTPTTAYAENGGRVNVLTAKDVDVTARVAFPTIGGDIGWMFQVRGTGSSNRYGADGPYECHLGYDGTFVTLDIGYWFAGSLTRVTLYTSSLTMTAGTLYRVRFEATSSSPTRLRGKVWVDGTSEPSTWQTDTSTFYGPDAAGWVAFTHTAGAATSSGHLYEWAVADANPEKSATDSGAGLDGASVVPSRPYQTEVLADVPRGYWRLGEASGSVLDSSGNAQSGIAVSTTRDVAGLITNGDDGAIDFNGTTSYVEITDNPFLDNGSRWSWECWFRLDTLGSQALMSRGGALTGDVTVAINSANKVQVIVAPLSITFLVTSTSAVSAATTYHLVVTKYNSDTRLYLNGADVSDLTGAISQPTPDGSAPLYIGRSSAADQHVDGKIDEVAIYGTDLPAIRVKAHYLAATGSSQVNTIKTGSDTGAGVDSATLTTSGNQSGSNATILAEDNFGRTVVGSLGTADVGGSYTAHGGDANLAVNSGSAALTIVSAYAEIGGRLPLSVADVEGYIDWTVTAAQAYLWTHARGQLTANRWGTYEFLLTVGSSVCEVYITHTTDAGFATTLASAVLSGVTYTSGDTFHMRYSCVGTALKVKVWEGAVEPGPWSAEATSSLLNSPGHIGFTAGGIAPHTVRADNWLVTAPAVVAGGDSGTGTDTSSLVITGGVTIRLATDSGAADEAYAETMTADSETGTGAESLPPVVRVGGEVIPPATGPDSQTEEVPTIIRRSRWKVDTGARIKL